MVDYYVSFLLREIGSVQPEEFCQTVNLCKQRVVTYLPLSEDKCEMCELVVEEVLLKLKDPDAQVCTKEVVCISYNLQLQNYLIWSHGVMPHQL